MTAYYMEVPDLEPQTLLYYNEIFKKTLIDVYNIYPREDWIDVNKSHFDRLTENLPDDYERGNTIHYNTNSCNVCYGYSHEYLTEHHGILIQVIPTSDKILIGAL